MERREITAAVVEEARRLLAAGVDPPTIATQLGITEYVLGVIARGCPDNVPAPGSRRSGQRVRNARRGIDAVTIRRVQRMLEVGWLGHGEIAREAGVSLGMVTAVARGQRVAITQGKPPLEEGERFLEKPIRCSVCKALLTVVPCRVCRTRREADGGAPL